MGASPLQVRHAYPPFRAASGKGVEILKEIKKPDKKIYIHCRSGNRARKAQDILARYGCRNINIIPISIMKMIEEGFTPVICKV
jgi:rhodanese-related sulfurtransferase